MVVVVTDGRDENAASTGPGSMRTWGEVLDKLEQTEAVVYPVGIGSNVDRARLQELADRSGGSAFFPADAASLADDYREDPRRAAPALRGRIRVHQSRPRRALADGGDPRPAGRARRYGAVAATTRRQSNLEAACSVT